MALELIILTPDHQTKRVPLEGDLLSVGRAHSNDLCYPEDASLSRQHLRFERDGQDWWAVDLGSKNGTLLNGTRISSRQLLRAGDRLSSGHLTLTVVDSEEETTGGVVFIPGDQSSPNATVMTSLEGLLSDEATTPAVTPGQPGPTPDQREAFHSPVVRALVRAGRELAGHQPLEELFPLILDLSIQAVSAERGVVMTLEDERLVSRAVHGDGFRISTTVRDRVLKEKTSILVRDLTQDEAFRQQVSISEQHIQTMMAVPLQTEDRVIGLIYVDSRSFVRAFSPDDLNLLTVLANVAAIRIEQQRLQEMERREQRRTADLQQAAEIQRGILPGKAPTLPGLDLAGHNAASRTVGGDYYDFLPYDDGRVAVVLGDVAGKGMSAALLMSNLQARVQILAEYPSDLGVLMSRLDQSIAANCPSNRFITLFFGVIEPEAGRLLYCNAGHNPPLIVHGSGEVERLKAEGTVLGILPELGYVERNHPFDAGDLIAIYSDGVTEAESPQGEEFGEERLAKLLTDMRTEPAETIVQGVLGAVKEFTADAPPADDITLVIARRLEP
jgi:serine phosphatase RsbU (regulator of sigma subunit)/pSer/pThr/pTyr-binding forkhead associated (FHA) protein